MTDRDRSRPSCAPMPLRMSTSGVASSLGVCLYIPTAAASAGCGQGEVERGHLPRVPHGRRCAYPHPDPGVRTAVPAAARLHGAGGAHQCCCFLRFNVRRVCPAPAMQHHRGAEAKSRQGRGAGVVGRRQAGGAGRGAVKKRVGGGWRGNGNGGIAKQRDAVQAPTLPQGARAVPAPRRIIIAARLNDQLKGRGAIPGGGGAPGVPRAFFAPSARHCAPFRPGARRRQQRPRRRR